MWQQHWAVGVAPRDDATTTQSLPDATFPGTGGCGIEVGDFNFDGFTDIALPHDFGEGPLGGAINCRRHYLLFDPVSGSFVQSDALSDLGDPSFEATMRVITSRSDDGRGGALYTIGTYRFEQGALVPLRRERRRWDDTARCIRERVEERRNGTMEIVHDELIGAGTSDLYESGTWDLVDARRVDMGSRLRGATIAILRSHAAYDPNDQSFLIDVILAQGNRVLYRFSYDTVTGVNEDAERRVGHGFLRAETEIRDVTNDGGPDLLFVSGEYMGLNEVEVYHVISCGARMRRCSDVRLPQFVTSRRQDFAWRTWKRGVVAVRVTPIPDSTCDYRYCAAPFKFDAYGWDVATKRFVVVRSLTTKERLKEDGLTANTRYVDRLLR